MNLRTIVDARIREALVKFATSVGTDIRQRVPAEYKDRIFIGMVAEENGTYTIEVLIAVPAITDIDLNATTFLHIEAKNKKALAFLWPNAPAGVAAKQKLFPIVFFKSVNVPVRGESKSMSEYMSSFDFTEHLKQW